MGDPVPRNPVSPSRTPARRRAGPPAPQAPPPLPDLREVLRERLAAPLPGGRGSALAAIVDGLIRRAAEGDVRAAALLLERAFGRVPDLVDVTTGGARLPVVPPIMWLDAGEPFPALPHERPVGGLVDGNGPG